MHKPTILCVCAAAFVLCLNPSTSAADPHAQPSQGALNGKRILLSPGHGWTWQNSSLFWYTQRGVTHGVVEDFSNAMLVIDYLAPYLTNAGAEVVIPRERSYQTSEFVGDDGDGSFTSTGTWTPSTNVAGYWGTGYRWTNASATESATARWSFALAAEGRYPVYVRFTEGTDRVTDALYRVHHGAGTTEVRLDQNIHQYTSPYDAVTEDKHLGGRWVFLGEWEFTPASGIAVELSNQSTSGAIVVADAVKVGGGMGSIDRGGGDSGRARWEECARYFAEYQGLPSSVWDVAGSDDSSDNVGTPSRQLLWWGDFDLHFALHSNADGGAGAARGTTTYTYDNSSTPTHPQSLIDASVAFATRVQNECMRVNNAWAAANGDTWQNRGLNTANFGEVRRNTKTPSCLLESCFHNNAQDAWYLRNPKWRHDTARAIYKAIARYFNAAAVVLPLPPTHLRAINTGSGEITLAWQAQADAMEPTATPTGYRVYLSNDGFAFDDGRAANAGAGHVLSGLAPGQTVYARVTATNAGGESLWSEVVCARTPDTAAQGLATPLLIVGGYDRLDEFTWYQQGATNRTGDMHMRNLFDSVRRHAQAAEQATTSGGGSYFFDGASNEAVASGAVTLPGYGLVDWVLGNESRADATFSAAEQALVSAYLAGGGKLFVSGAEIGWDLGHASGSSVADRAFYNGVLEAAYVADDSNDYTVAGLSGGPFAGLVLTFDDGTGSSYTVDYPDVIAATGSSAAILEYSPGVVAGVQAAGAIVLGFPFETINEGAARDALMQSVLRESLPAYTGVNPTSPPPGGSGSSGNDSGDDEGGCAAGPVASAPMLIGLLAIWSRRRRVCCRSGLGR